MEELIIIGKEFASLNEFKSQLDIAQKTDRQYFVVRSSHKLPTRRAAELASELAQGAKDEVSIELPTYSAISYRCGFGPERRTTSKGVRKAK